MAVDTADAFTAQNIVTTPPQTLSEVARATGTTFILALFVTLSGKPCAKLVPIEAVEQHVGDEATDRG